MLIIRTLTTWSTIQVFCNMGLIQLSYLALLFLQFRVCANGAKRVSELGDNTQIFGEVCFFQVNMLYV